MWECKVAPPVITFDIDMLQPQKNSFHNTVDENLYDFASNGGMLLNLQRFIEK